MKAWLQEVHPEGKAKQFEGERGTFFLELRGEVTDDAEHLRRGDLFAISADSDAEPGDLVVWWTGSAASLALARVGSDLRLSAVAGFPPPSVRRGGVRVRSLGQASIRGVVVGRLRRLRPAS